MLENSKVHYIPAKPPKRDKRRLRNDFPEAYKTANDLLKRINNGEFIMPKI